MSFYVTLPSNSSMDLYPNNCLREFAIRLKEPIRLDIQYEVALLKFTYKHSWSLEVGKLSTIEDMIKKNEDYLTKILITKILLYELDLEKPVQLEGQYEVALVQSVFQDVFTGSLATLNIFPSSSGMEMSSFDLSANDGESVEKIIERLNRKIFDEFYSKNIQVPIVKLNEAKAEFTFDLPRGWQCFITDVDQNYLVADLPTAKNAAEDALNGNDPKESVRNRLKESKKNIYDKFH
ncbi:unnamed protein product [Brachionus calyciflorus]|uniref:Uncharacterized protein n=1 Tax=Brachionus calyciflorus TaxID=104777 RepID=A0A814MP49_9BILA|nr:unnamed protein product [Brachionus calyciflorus]